MAHTTAANHDAVERGDAHPEGPSALAYFVIFIILLVLLFLSVGVAYIRKEGGDIRALLTFIGFAIAGIKALLVIMYFMHVRFSSRLVWLFALGSFFFLGIMVWLTMNDYASRTPVVEEVHTYPAEPSSEGQMYRPVDRTGINYSAPSDPLHGH